MEKNKNKILVFVGAVILVVLAIIIVSSFDNTAPTKDNDSSSDASALSEENTTGGNSGESSGNSESSGSSFGDSSASQSDSSIVVSSSSADSTSTSDSSPADSSSESESTTSDTTESTTTEDNSSSRPVDDDDDFPESRKEGLYYTPAPLVKDDNTKYVAFTFDDGPSQHTDTLLNYLEEKGIVLTFFYVGDRLDGNDKYGAYVKRAVDIGCEPAVHCYTHENYFHNCSDSTYKYEVEKTADVIYNYAGCYPITMRPPGGSITAKRAAESAYNIIIWSVDSNDWKYSKRSDSNVETIKNNILGDFYNNPDCLDGKIILLHDLYENSVEAFMEVADILIAEGYQFVTVSQLCELNHSTTVGKQYYSEYYSK